ncbi:MAG: hypothetical protein IPK00_03075 [Deltaproteobacteria bacterium]|nr:hypothetical protein [Deltaproteobacteria bacterium]
MSAAPIRFGTSGWRGVLGEEVTFARLRVLVRSIAEWVGAKRDGRRVLVGFDGRFASRAMAEIAVDVLAEAGLAPELARACTATPVVTHALARGRYAAGLVLTASHNPPAHHGLKVFDASGAAIDDRAARRIESIARRRRAQTAPAPEARRRPPSRDLGLAYQEALSAALDPSALRRAGLTVVYDAMHGAAGGLLDAWLRRAGVAVESLRSTRDPGFGGGAPDPVAQNLAGLVAATQARSGLVLGLANDGDGDRVGAVDGGGRVLSETQLLALLVDHLAARGRLARGIAIGAATGTLVEKVAQAHGLVVERHPIGFKALSCAILAGRVEIAGEESGGFAWSRMGPDKDGMLAAALLVELVAGSGLPLESHIDRLEARFGPSACGRVALEASPARDSALKRLMAAPPTRVDRQAVGRVDGDCGLRLALADGGFLMLRRSGTESVIRIYAEAGDGQQLARRLREGIRLLERAAR